MLLIYDDAADTKVIDLNGGRGPVTSLVNHRQACEVVNSVISERPTHE